MEHLKPKQMKLTAAIAASYFGAEVKVNGYYNNDSTPKEIVGTMTHVGLMSIGTGGGQYSYSQCQLLLTPLSKISDEDAVEVAKMFFVYAPNGTHITKQTREDPFKREWARLSFMDGDVEKIIANISDNSIQLCSGNMYFENSVKVANYLRSKSYDIDNLIAAGVAVEKH